MNKNKVEGRVSAAEKLVTVADVAYRERVCKDTVYKWVKTGVLTPHSLVGRGMRFTLEGVDRDLKTASEEQENRNR